SPAESAWPSARAAAAAASPMPGATPPPSPWQWRLQGKGNAGADRLAPRRHPPTHSGSGGRRGSADPRTRVERQLSPSHRLQLVDEAGNDTKPLRPESRIGGIETEWRQQ